MACQNHYYYDQYGYSYYSYPTYTTTYTPTTVTPTQTITYNTQADGSTLVYDPYGSTSYNGCTHYNIPEYPDTTTGVTATATASNATAAGATVKSTTGSNTRQRPPANQTKTGSHSSKPGQFTQTDEEIINQVKALAEIALSNQGLSKEPYLLRQISRSAKGFISLKLIASLRQVRRVTRNVQLINEAMRRSTLLELHEDGQKVRRNESLPESLTKRGAISTILAIRVSEQDAEIDRLSSIFKIYGKIQQMRVVPPEKKLPAYLLGYATQVPELGRDICAIIEFESDLAAMAACKAFHHSRASNEAGMRVALLGPRIKRSLYGNRRNSNGSLSCQSSVISSLDVSLEECVISSENITDTDSGFHQTDRERIPSGSGSDTTPEAKEDPSTTSTPVKATVINNTTNQTTTVKVISPLATQATRGRRKNSVPNDSEDSS
jgi:hypothetical protein